MSTTTPRARGRVAAAFVVAMGAALLLAGCAEPAKNPMPQERIAPRDLVPYERELVDERPQGWDELEVIDEHRIRVNFTIPGQNACVRYAANVTETDDDVAISLVAGRLPGTEDLCKPPEKAPRAPGEPFEIIELYGIEEYETIVVTLEEPLGDRELVGRERTR